MPQWKGNRARERDGVVYLRGKATGAGGRPFVQDYLRIDWYLCTGCLRMVNDRVVHDRWHNAFEQDHVKLPELSEHEKSTRSQLLPRNVAILRPHGDPVDALHILREGSDTMAVVSRLPESKEDQEGGDNV